MVRVGRLPEPRPQTLFASGCHETVGDTGAGKALNLVKLGLPTTLHALVGDDEPGRRVRDFLLREGVTLLLDTDPQGTERHVNLMADDGSRISIYVAYASHQPEIDLPAIEQAMASADHLVINIINYCRRLLPIARRLGRPVWCDLHDWDGHNPHHRDFIAAADYLFLSSDALPEHRAFMQAQIAAGKPLVVCTHGRAGSTAATADGQWFETPAVAGWPQVDSNGAGDAFFAGYLWAHDQGRPTAQCLRVASVVAALCVGSAELADLSLSPHTLADAYRRAYGEPL